MKVVVDALAATTGGGITYLRSLLGAALDADRELELVLVTARSDPFASLLGDKRVRAVRPLGQSPPLARRVVWELALLGRFSRELGGDVLFCPSEIAPVGAGLPVVLGLQNPNLYGRPVRYASLLQEARLQILARVARSSTRRAAALLFVSEPFREQAARQLRSRAAVEHVVEPGLDASFFDGADDRAFDHLRPYVLSVSDFYPYKNFPRLVEAFAAVRRPGLRLVIAGRPVDRHAHRATVDAAGRFGVGERVSLLGPVPLDRMPSLYAGAECFVFPSLLESFGFPPLEAMACGVPVVCSRASVMPAVCGDAPLYVDATDARDIASGLERMLDDPELASAAVIRGRRWVARYTWKRAGTTFATVLHEVAGGC